MRGPTFRSLRVYQGVTGMMALSIGTIQQRWCVSLLHTFVNISVLAALAVELVGHNDSAYVQWL